MSKMDTNGEDTKRAKKLGEGLLVHHKLMKAVIVMNGVEYAFQVTDLVLSFRER